MKLTQAEQRNLAFMAEENARSAMRRVVQQSNTKEARAGIAQAERWFDIADALRTGMAELSE